MGAGPKNPVTCFRTLRNCHACYDILIIPYWCVNMSVDNVVDGWVNLCDECFGDIDDGDHNDHYAVYV